MNCVFSRSIAALVSLLYTTHHAVNGSEEHGPRFTVEPPVSVFFSNATGARVECVAEGTPQPLVRWQTVRDGMTVTDVRDVLHVNHNGTLVFSPFSEHQYSPEVHSAAYRCIAHSRAGTIVSRTVQVKAEVIRNFEPIVRDTVTMPGNVAVFTCHIPGLSYSINSGLPESVAITSWVQDGVFNIFPSWEIDSKIIMVPKTGELRIANVDENDLRHSYTCRIVNKLTGFTQESSTFGRIYFESNRTMAPWSKSAVYTVHLVKQGDHLLLPCDVYGFPPPQITWSSSTSTLIVSESSGRNKAPMNFLRLRSAQRTDAGNYSCTATNSVGHLTLHHRVIVAPDMSAQVIPALAEIEAGRSATFTCITSSSDDNQIITWLKNGEPRQSSTLSPPTYTLNIDSVQKDDQGMYQCVVTNKLNNEMAQSFAELRLSASKPSFKYKFIGHLLKPGPDVSLKCIAYGTPTPHITWKFDGFDIPLSKMRVSVSQYVTETGDVISHFNITKVQVEDGGVYECVVSNRAGKISHSAKLQIYGNPVAKKTPKIIARAGQQLHMTCPISGYPIFNINWEKDNKKLPGAKSTNKRYKVFANGSIIIDNIQKKTDQGMYFCEGSNDKHAVKASVDVNVIEPPNIHPFTIGEGYHEGGRVGWQCFITKGDGPLSIHWLKNNQTLDAAAAVPPLSISYQNEYSSSLLIESIKLAHEGNYTCRASNPVATVDHTVTLTVLVAPEWIFEPKDVNVIRDDQAEINCSASGHPKPTIKWRKGSSKDSDQFTDVNDNVTADGSLIINKVTKKHEGYYMCEASNDIGSPISSIIHLNVQDLPHIILPNTKYTSINGGIATMACEATGDQPIHISWIKGSIQLSYKSANPRYNVEEIYTDTLVRSKLIISKVNAADSGRYVCVAENSLGKHEAAMELEIKVLGSPPDDLSCNDTTPTSIRLRWTDLNANNPTNDYVLGYVLIYSKLVSPDDLINEYDEIEVFQNGDDATISDLETNTAYEFSIKVNTVQGPGKPSKSLICKTSESLPDPPDDLKAILLSPNTALITWIPPKYPNGQIQRYTLYEREKLNGMQGAVKSQSFEHHVRQVQLSMFRHTSSYLWWVTATNGIGEGEKSKTATLSTARSGGIPASIGSFHNNLHTKWHVDIELPCIISGSPTPNVKWTFNGQPIDLQGQKQQVYENYTLHLTSVINSDSGNYTCTAWNVYGSDNVTTTLLVVEPPKPPILGVLSISWTNITVNWTKAPNTYAVQQYLLSYKYVNEMDNMYTEIALSSRTNMFTLPNVKCDTTVAFSISASNRIGHGMQSKPFTVKTLQGQTPLAPSQDEAIEQMVTGFLIHLQKWNPKQCPITHFSVYKKHSTEKEWTIVGENVVPTGIFSVDNLNPATHYNILVKSFNSAGMTSTVFATSTLAAYGEGNFDKEPLSINDKIFNSIYNIVLMWPLGLIILSLIVATITLIACYKYRHLYKKNQRNLEPNNMILKKNSCSRAEIHSDTYETCTPFKSKSTILTNDEPNYNEISPYATFQISPNKSPKRNKQYFCTNCGENVELCNCNRLYCSQTDYTNFVRRPIPKRTATYSDNNNEDSKSQNGSVHEFYDIERSTKTCESIKKSKRRFLPLPDSRRASNQNSRDFRNLNLHETTFMMPVPHHGMYGHSGAVTDDEEPGSISSVRGSSRPLPYRVCY
ncbi:cell adhesion molecule Dscam2-like isoform X2 [Daktulosphaira vitifoliae]|uniref:cell adhesion molecule Dscam2-like isoform X2 n=1 Tax=Daktulosphaira vitifoliae TaxID=58002 RepID=UPI0021AAA6A8|nr:cell adhesion molecule Dscam2-like isoform X2 [Daktulosphaira vitifoliae]